MATMSACVKENLFCVGSVTSHFCEFSGVNIPNSFRLLEMAWYAMSLKLLVSIAVPKYSFPAATMSAWRPWPPVSFCAAAPATKPVASIKPCNSLVILTFVAPRSVLTFLPAGSCWNSENGDRPANCVSLSQPCLRLGSTANSPYLYYPPDHHPRRTVPPNRKPTHFSLHGP